MRRVDDLLPYALNNKNHPPEQIAALAGLIRETGFRFPIAVDEEGGVIAGHGRLLAARKLGMTEVPCIVHADLDERQKRALRIADNRLAEMAETNKGNLAAELRGLQAAAFDLSLLGYDGDAVEALERAAAGVTYRPGAQFPQQGVEHWNDADEFYTMPPWLAPIWDATEDCIVQFSGGKDSTAAALWAAWATKKHGNKKLTLAFVDPGVEFPGMGGHIRDVAAFLECDYVILKPKEDWWAWIAEKGWPSILYRPCANDLIHKVFGRFVREHKPGTVVLTGSRAEEANRGSQKTERSELQSLGSKAKDYQHFAPCFAVKKVVENEVIARSGIPLWEGYSRGFVRTACWCCPGQCGAQALALTREYPGLCQDIRRWEKRLGKIRPSDDLRFDDLVRAGEKAEERAKRKVGVASDPDDLDARGSEEPAGET